MQKKPYRHELKYVINTFDYHTLLSRLRAVAAPDSHCGENGSYQVTSLYFDNLDNKALREKIDGVNHREKFRIRYYNHDLSFLSLEKKSKVNGLCRKQSARISKQQFDALLQGDLSWMKESGMLLVQELYGKMCFQRLRPKTLVEYIREPFVYPAGNTRVTIDREIRTGAFSGGLLNPEAPSLKAHREGCMVLEVKFDEFLPDLIRTAVQTGCRQGTAFSKYAACRIYG